VVDDILRAYYLPTGRDFDLFKAGLEQHRLNRRAIEIEQVLELEFHPTLAHQASRPAVETRNSDEEQATWSQHPPQLFQIGERIACVLDHVRQDRHVEAVVSQCYAVYTALKHALGAQALVGGTDRAFGDLDTGHLVSARRGLQ
jgi:hypothetical protein